MAFFGYGQCPQSVTITSSNPTICSGNSVTLTATPSGGVAPYSYTWSTGETKQSIDVNKAGTYKVTVTGATRGCQPVTSTINITVSPTPDAPAVANVTICPNTSGKLTPTAPGGLYQWYDANGNFLLSGDSYTTPVLTSNRSYYVQTTVNGCTSARTQVFVLLTSKPNVTGATICAGNVAVLSADGGDTFDWYSNSSASGAPIFSGSTFTTPILNVTTTYYVVATNNGCRSIPTQVTATVTTPPQKPVVKNTNPSVCSGMRANLHAEDAPGVFAWFDVPSGGTALIYSPDFTTPPLTAPKTYYVQNSINDCESSRTAVTVNVTPIPAAPAPVIETPCAGTSTTITLPTLPSGTYEWYDAPSGGTLLQTGNSYITPVLNSATNYYVLANNGGCSSTRTLIKVIINPSPPVPSVSGAIICYNSATTLTATGPGGTYSWFNAASGGTAIVTNSPNGSFLTPALLTTTTYYVQTKLNGCTSARTPVTVTVLPQVTPPTASPTSTCSGNSAALTATGGSATATYDWYATQTGGTSLFTGQVFVTPPITVNTIYYVQITENGCSSTRTPVTVTVNPIPTAPTATGTTICQGTSANLSTSASGTINWYDVASGGTSLKTGSNFTTPILNSTTTFYVQNTTGTCVSNRTPVVVTVTSPNNPQFQYPTGTVCTASSNVTPVINNPLGGTFSASSAGLVFVSTTTGEINISASSPGSYTITFTGTGTCVVPQTASFSIVTVANAAFSYKPGYCQDENNPRPTFNAGASAGSFSATPVGLVFVNTSTGEIDLKRSKAGNYTITNNITASGGCASASSSTSIIIYESVTVNAGPDQTVSVGTPVQLKGTITGGATTGKWSGGSGSFSNASSKSTVYTPGAGETSATLTLTSDDPPGLCGPKSDQVIITFKASPASPTVTGNSTCKGSSATLTAIAPGGTYRWYDVATGGTSLKTGPVFVTPVLMANATYYVETVNSVGVASPRTMVVVTVNAIPAAPVVTGLISVCIGNTTTLTTNNPAGSYEWYDAPVGGNKLSVTDTYTSPALTGPQTYYVQQIVNGCIGERTKVDVTVSTIPTVTSSNSDIICSGSPLSYTITSDVPTATFLWSRAQFAGISNAAVTNKAGNTINETLINTSSDAVNVTYVITPMNGSCAGTPFNYIVTVYPTPTVTSDAAKPICNGTPVDYTITFNTITDFSWSRNAIPGITNVAVSGQASGTIKEALFNTTNAPIDVTYFITSSTGNCQGTLFPLKVTVNPDAQITSAATNPGACSGEPQNYTITSSIPSATFLWSRGVVPNISNAAVSNKTSAVIDEALINTGNSAVKVTYFITPVANGCPGTLFKYVVTVNPQVIAPQPNVNSPICVGSTITLQTTAVAKATYTWTGSNGKTYTGQKVEIPNGTKGDAGLYSLTIQVNGCTSAPRSVSLVVNDPPTVDAGQGKVVCVADPTIDLHGTIGGGVPTGIWTVVSGTGTFYPSVNYPATTQYIPTAADTAAGKVVLRLTATRKDECGGVSSDVTFKFGPLPAAFAGPDQNVCSQTNSVQLSGKILIVSTVKWEKMGSASGSFSPSETDLNAVYIPSAADIASGSVKLELVADKSGPCDNPRDTMQINFIPPPSVNAGGTRYVLKNRTITLTPTVSDNNVKYLWTPNIDINDNTVKNPVITGDVDRTYTLQVTDSRDCVSTDTTFIKVSPLIVIPNTFTPNGDGVNDLWNIEGLIAYTDATVDIFTRYGQKVYHSVGYDKPWDGIYNGKALPVGVYYYVINTKLFNQVFSGSLTIIR
ncbi:gliding motility-associated C-terminal domain-containing protein [Mucilaginibacter sp. BJC16-A38]|uniref:gliding motility-associated C-terminal domain-containing protein n=1 Tax=Mucilaginibacter phenanthrenivorans TaxID=1234842 RepID=UPI002157CE21|nr:gliding motility-associated C-terminal domain-containing protein [Mucilaginibacter phenanthrenivorans]MCR8556626.1 gliding motility-associated C-terminal domain-containing protein [Mucilaginibacter phenanthrenivorans]